MENPTLAAVNLVLMSSVGIIAEIIIWALEAAAYAAASVGNPSQEATGEEMVSLLLP